MRNYILPLFFLVFLGGVIYLANSRLNKPVVIVKEHAAEVVAKAPSLAMSPLTVSTSKLGETFQIVFTIDSSTESATATNLTITYDPNLLAINAPVVYGSYFPVLLKPTVINNGEINMVLGRKPTEQKTGFGVLATVTFTALKYGSGVIGYKNSQVAAIGRSSNIISDISFTKVSIVTPTAIPIPTSTVIPTPAPKITVITIYAAGTSCIGVYPTMELIVNSRVVASWSNIDGNAKLRKFITYSYSFRGDIIPNSIKVRFTNDKLTNNEDRNLLIDKITVGNITYESESSQTYSTGAWGNNTGCAAGYKKLELLSCNGYFSYPNK